MISFLVKTRIRFLIFLVTIIFAVDVSWCSSKFYVDDAQHCRVSARHIEAGGIGYNKGYTTLEGFFSANPYPRAWELMPFLDLKAHVFDNGKVATNFGVGLRKMIRNRVYGFNAYYDFRNLEQLDYNQVGLGLETLGQRWDLRVNGYLPVGKKVTTPYENDFHAFSGNEMILLQKYREVMTGFNAEFGVHFGKNKYCDFYATAGTYYFNDREKIGTNFWGGKARLLVKFKKYWTIELSNSYDKVFRDRFQGQLTFTIPFGGGGSCTEQTDEIQSYHSRDLLCARMVQSVDRQEIIVIEDFKQCVPAIDPTTGKPFNFVFVDNESHSAGTYESPYPTLALAQTNSKPGDIIYVFPGDGTTKGMNAGITLQNKQKFWGSGIDHTVQASQGTFVIPAQSSSAPTMTNKDIDTDGNGITLDAINEISGINLKGVTTSAIFGADVSNLTISNCTIEGTMVYPIQIASSSQSTVSILDNVIKNNTDGCNFTFNGESVLSVMNNSITGTTSRSDIPLAIESQAAPLIASVSNNTISNNTTGALQFILNDTNRAQLNITGNTIANNTSGDEGGGIASAIYISPNHTGSGSCTLNVASNKIIGNAASCVYVKNDGAFNDFSGTVIGNTMTNNGGSGIAFDTECNTFTLTAKNNTITDGNDNGIAILGDAFITTANVTISDNTITGCGNQATAIAIAHSGTTFNFTVHGNNLSNNEGSGILMYPGTGLSQVTIDIQNNTVSNNLDTDNVNTTGGIDLEQFINLSGIIKNNTMLGNVGPGAYVGSTLTSPSACITMSGNSSDSGYTLSSGDGTFNLAPCNADVVNIGDITAVGTVTPVQSCPGAQACS